jgi:hypothetical protein
MTNPNDSIKCLTKREAFAKAALQGLLSDRRGCAWNSGMYQIPDPTDDAAKLADALIARLNSTEVAYFAMLSALKAVVGSRQLPPGGPTLEQVEAAIALGESR